MRAEVSADVIRAQRWAIARALAEALLKFDPSQPRDEDGKWTSGGGSAGSGEAPTAFVSPNVSNLSFSQAVSALGSKGQANLKQAGEFIDGRLGITATNQPVIGAWADGAENSMMITAAGATTQQMRAASAMKGWLADQKSVLIFEPAQNGDAFMAHFDVVGKPDDVHAKLLKDGLAFHTLQPLGGDAIRVHVYGSDQETIDAIDKAATDAQTNVRFIPGRGEFLGTTKDTGSDREQRDDARRVYEEAIRQISSAGTLAGRDIGKVWDEARDYWQSLSAAKGLSCRNSVLKWIERERAAIREFDPNQPRDEDGKWTSGGGGGGGAATPTAAPVAPAAPSSSSGKAARVQATAAVGVQRGAEKALAAGIKPLQGSEGHPNLLATRFVTAKGANRNVYTRPDVAGMKLNEANFARDVALFDNANFYPNFRPSDLAGTPDQVVQNVKDHMKENLRALYSDAGASANETKLWYDGARIMVDERAEKYGFNDSSVAGVYAALSPQKDWNMNVYLGDAVMDTYATKQDHAWDTKMDRTADRIWPTEKNKAILERVRGKSLQECPTAVEKAMWIRTYDEAHSNRHYRMVNSDGTFGDNARNLNGSLSRAAWQTLPSITNAVKAIEANGDPAKLADAMGSQHKVRSFFNNILDPNSDNRDVTIDTHAVGAALLRPIGSSDAAYLQASAGTPNVGKKPVGWQAASGSARTGVYGLYGVYADAVRETADELGVQPRQLQSVTWEAKRTLFSRSITDRQKAQIEAAWHAYRDDPNITLADTQRRVLEIARRQGNA